MLKAGTHSRSMGWVMEFIEIKIFYQCQYLYRLWLTKGILTLHRWNFQRVMIEIEKFFSLSFCIIFNLCLGQMYEKLVCVFCSVFCANWIYLSWADKSAVPYTHSASHSHVKIISELTWWFKRYSIQNGIMHLTVYKWYHICMGIVGRLLFFCLFCCNRHAHTELPSLSPCMYFMGLIWSGGEK